MSRCSTPPGLNWSCVRSNSNLPQHRRHSWGGDIFMQQRWIDMCDWMRNEKCVGEELIGSVTRLSIPVSVSMKVALPVSNSLSWSSEVRDLLDYSLDSIERRDFRRHFTVRVSLSDGSLIVQWFLFRSIQSNVSDNPSFREPWVTW